jgi:hypothetical protein
VHPVATNLSLSFINPIIPASNYKSTVFKRHHYANPSISYGRMMETFEFAGNSIRKKSPAGIE